MVNTLGERNHKKMTFVIISNKLIKISDEYKFEMEITKSDFFNAKNLFDINGKCISKRK